MFHTQNKRYLTRVFLILLILSPLYKVVCTKQLSPIDLWKKSQQRKNKTKTTTTERTQITMYKPKEHLKPSGLIGISDDQINDHWLLYKGYVAQVNTLHDELKALAQQGQGATLAYADRRRRYGFEYNGMVLHEYYFENMTSKGKALAAGELKTAIEKTWGSFENWQKDFEAAGKTRGIGWAILYLDRATNCLSNHFVAEHQNGHIAGFKPILVMDIWEHAYMVDHRAGGRGKYIEAFIKNIDWDVVTKRHLPPTVIPSTYE